MWFICSGISFLVKIGWMMFLFWLMLCSVIVLFVLVWIVCVVWVSGVVFGVIEKVMCVGDERLFVKVGFGMIVFLVV